MARISLTGMPSAQVALSENPIIILESKSQKGYKMDGEFLSFGEIFILVYNELINEIDEYEKSSAKYGYELYPAPDYGFLQGLDLTEIVDFVETGNLSANLEEKINANTTTLPFRVGIYEGTPVLYYLGFKVFLFSYDLLMIKRHNVKIKFCKDCGNAFFPKTRGEYCPSCKNSDIRNKAKYKRLKEDPTRLLFTRLQQRIQKREKLASQYRILFENLAAKNKEIHWLEKWSELDKRYQKLKRYCMAYNSSMTESAWDKLIKNSKISSIEEFEKWIYSQEQANFIIEKNT